MNKPSTSDASRRLKENRLDVEAHLSRRVRIIAWRLSSGIVTIMVHVLMIYPSCRRSKLTGWARNFSISGWHGRRAGALGPKMAWSPAMLHRIAQRICLMPAAAYRLSSMCMSYCTGGRDVSSGGKAAPGLYLSGRARANWKLEGGGGVNRTWSRYSE